MAAAQAEIDFATNMLLPKTENTLLKASAYIPQCWKKKCWGDKTGPNIHFPAICRANKESEAAGAGK